MALYARVAADELLVGFRLRHVCLGATLRPRQLSTSAGAKTKRGDNKKTKPPQKAKSTAPTLKEPIFPPGSSPLLYDIGANLCDRMFQGEYNGKAYHESDLPLVLQRSKRARVGGILCTAGNLAEAKEAIALTKKHSSSELPLFSTVGVHPTRCSEFDAYSDGPDAYMEQLRQLINDGVAAGKVIAIGEFGLDYDRLKFCPADVQRKYFVAQLKLAEETKLPLFLHMRAAAEDFARIVKENRHRFEHGVAHSFTGTVEEMKMLVDLGLHIGINGCSLRTEEALECVRQIPLDRLLIETDAPWCGMRKSHAGYAHIVSHWPTKTRKKFSTEACVDSRSEPCHLRQVFEVIAAVKQIPTNELAEVLRANTHKVFPQLTHP